MSTYPGCEASVRHQSQTAIVCSNQHCDSFTESDTFHQQCASFGKGNTSYPVSTAQCLNLKTKAISEPVYNSDYHYYSCPEGSVVQTCYCCCACLAFGTPIAVPGGVKAIELFGIGDDVTVGNWESSKLSWNIGTVKFSSGTSPGSKNTMMLIDYGDKKQLIATPDNLFLLPNGKLKRADRLVPYKDQIMGADGTSLNVNSIHSGEWSKGLHHIATTGLEFTDSLDGHLINANGIVSGDYCLQVNQHELIKMGLMDDPANTPAHGSKEFANSNPHLTVNRASAVKLGEDINNMDSLDGFISFKPDESTYLIPHNAAKFLTDAQAKDIVDNSKATFRDLHDDSGFESMTYLIKLFKGFYPNINIVIDKTNQNFNTYAFEMYNKKHLVISGEILRMNGLYNEAYKFILAQGISRLIGLQPFNSDGLTYVGAADYYATSSVLRKVFYLAPNDFYDDLVQQITTLFGYISKENSAGNPHDLANDPPKGCRIGSLQTGIFGGNVLPCSCSDLELLTVFSDSSGSTGQFLELIFSQPINPESIKDLYNFEFSLSNKSETKPKVLSAKVNTWNSKGVVLRVQSPVEQEFTIKVMDLSSVGGSVLNDKDSGTFKFSSKQ